ncbi:uncharacterized protein LOC133790157 [Humulus lupulus]|uniref:uncharacterized protein LOC133790157 n=1 Tax=Humulus lupulus TaxID=3486 RepID=UPI002B401C27|nr:uncharacterized protein LOC133790157 [Humulus lupulus]
MILYYSIFFTVSNPKTSQEERTKMKPFKKLHHHHHHHHHHLQQHHLFLLIILTSFFLTSYASKDSLTIRTCGKIPIQEPFFSIQTSNLSSPFNHMLLCQSQKLYYRTSVGLFPISSINYTTKLLTISDTCSSPHYYFSLSVGFPKPSKPNSLLLLNCSNSTTTTSTTTANSACLSLLQTCGVQEDVVKKERCSSSIFIDDFENLDMGFHPRHLNCSHYTRLYYDEFEGVKLGTRVSFDVPDHLPNICNECEKPNGNCGVGLRCMCHPKECKDKVISKGGSLYDYVGKIMLVSLVSFLVVMLSVEF